MPSVILPPLILASESPYRKIQMQSLGLPFSTSRPQIDEDSEKLKFQTPQKMAVGLARLKALSLKSKDQIIIGGDQLIHLEGQILGKPKTREKAIEQLQLLQGKTHKILTALCVVYGEKIHEHLDSTLMTLRSLSRLEIESYVDLDQPLDCAGSYKIEKNARPLFSKIETQDFSAIEGLPLLNLSKILQTYGYAPKEIKSSSAD
jgi:septum formation protein